MRSDAFKKVDRLLLCSREGPKGRHTAQQHAPRSMGTGMASGWHSEAGSVTGRVSTTSSSSVSTVSAGGSTVHRRCAGCTSPYLRSTPPPSHSRSAVSEHK